jgi:hypothetical protein
VALAILAGTNLAYHFPILMVVLARLVTGEDPAAAVLTAADFRQRIIEPAVFARCLHFWARFGRGDRVGGCRRSLGVGVATTPPATMRGGELDWPWFPCCCSSPVESGC